MAFTNPHSQKDEHYTTYTTANRVLSLFPPEFFAGKMIDCCCDGWFDGENGAHGLNEVIYYQKQGQQDVWRHGVNHCSAIVEWLDRQIKAGVIHPASITLSGYTGPKGQEQDALLVQQYGMSWQQLNFRKYDLVITNPPFSENQGIQLLNKCVANGNDFILWNHHRRIADIDFLRLLVKKKVYLAVGQAFMEFMAPQDQFRQVCCNIYTSQPVWQGEGAPKGKTLFCGQRNEKLLRVYYPDEQHIDFPLHYNKRIYRKGKPKMLPVKNVQWIDKVYPLGSHLPHYGSSNVPFKNGIYLVPSRSFLDGYLYETPDAKEPLPYRIIGMMFPHLMIEVTL